MTDTLKKIQQQVNEDTVPIIEVVNALVKEYCEPLDEYMKFIRDVLKDDENPPTDSELDDFVLNIPVFLYFASESQEGLGIKEDVAKSIKQQIYNTTYASTSGTVAERSAAAELQAQNESLVHLAYSRAYKICKAKVDAAYEVLNSVKKVITRRLQELEISNGTVGRTGGNYDD